MITLVAATSGAALLPAPCAANIDATEVLRNGYAQDTEAASDGTSVVHTGHRSRCGYGSFPTVRVD